MNRAGRLGFAALAGAVAAFGLAPFGFWPATLLGFAIAGRLALAGNAGWTLWAFGTGYFAHALLWIVQPFLVEPLRTGWMAPFALVFMAGGLAIFWGLAGWVAERLASAEVPRFVLLILALALSEVARAYVLTGFPWAGPAQIWLDTPAAQLLAYVGPHGLGLLTMAAGVMLGMARLRPVLAVAPGLVLTVAAFAAAALRPEPVETGKTLRLVQPNAPQHQKWDPRFAPLFVERQLEFSAAPGAPDLIVWPETAIPYWLDQAAPVFQAIAARSRGIPVVLGILRQAEDGSYRNSLVTLDGAGQVTQVHDKHHLVPFGEFVPLRGLAERIGLAALAAQGGNFLPGAGPQLLDLGDVGKAIPLICYEAVFPRHSSLTGPRPDLLLQVTNDAWFGTWSGPYQHLAQARMRAIEQGVPLARAANTGVSAMIDPLGRVTDSIPLGEAGYIDAALPAPVTPTIYSQSGDLPVIVLMVIGFLTTMFAFRRSSVFKD